MPRVCAIDCTYKDSESSAEGLAPNLETLVGIPRSIGGLMLKSKMGECQPSV